MNIKKALERALHLETVKRTEEEEQTQRIAAIRRDETEILIDSMNRLDQQMSVGNENYNRAVMVEETTATGEERDAMETNIGNKSRLCGREGYSAKNCRNYFNCRSSTHMKRICHWNKRTEKST